MNITTTQIICSIAAVYLLYLGCVFNTSTIFTTLLYKVTPFMLAFFLGLMVFGVIK